MERDSELQAILSEITETSSVEVFEIDNLQHWSQLVEMYGIVGVLSMIQKGIIDCHFDKNDKYMFIFNGLENGDCLVSFDNTSNLVDIFYSSKIWGPDCGK